MTHAAFEPEPLNLRSRLAVAVPTASIVSALYAHLGSDPHHLAAPHALPLDAMIPFVPASVWIYLPGYLLGFVLALLLVPNQRVLRAACMSLLSVNLLAAPVYYFHAVAGPRPPAPEGAGVTEAFVRWLYAFDPNYNTLPSLHVAQATLCAVIVSSVSPRVGRVSWGLAVAVWVSTLTLKQHWVVDVPGGLLLAAVGAMVYQAQLTVVPRVLPQVLSLLPVRR